MLVASYLFVHAYVGFRRGAFSDTVVATCAVFFFCVDTPKGIGFDEAPLELSLWAFLTYSCKKYIKICCIFPIFYAIMSKV